MLSIDGTVEVALSIEKAHKKHRQVPITYNI